MAENIKVRWLVDHEQIKIAPKTISTQILNEDGTCFKDTVENAITNVETEIVTHASNGDIHVTAEEKEAWSNIEVPSLDGYATEEYVENLYKKLNSNTILGFYCVEDVTIVTNGISKTYPANSNVQVSFIEDDVFEIIPTSDNSILSLSAFPGALGTYYSWLEGVRLFSNILFDMNDEAMYSKWSQGNQGSYQVQFAQYTNCIFWSDNPYISDVTKRTNYTLCSTSQLPLCYSSIPENTFKSFYLAFGVTSDPNWSNPAYKNSFAQATWATQAFSYYGARIIGFPGHDSGSFTITLPKDCRGLMFDARNIECAGTFDAVNTTNFGAKSGSWREAFGDCPSLRRLYIKNLKVSLNISWSPVDYDSISYIVSKAANTNKITISVSPYTYNLLSQSDFDLAASKNITIELLTTNYVEDKRLSAIVDKADKTEVEAISTLVGDTPVSDQISEAVANMSTGADWNQNDETAKDYIKNRPFGEIVIGGDTITWDGNTEGLDYANSDMNGKMCKISDAIITLDDLQNGCQYFINVPEYPEDGGLIPLEPYDIVDFGTALVSGDFYIAFVSEPNTVVNDWTLPSTGVYVRWNPSSYISSLTINGYTGFITETIKTIDQKYLPEPLRFGTSAVYGDTLTWDGNIEGRTCVLSDIPDDSSKIGWCLMSDYVLTPDDFTEGFKDTYFFINSEEIGVISNQEDMGHHFLNDGVFWTGSGRTICVPYDNYEFEGTLYPNKGIYFYFVIYNGELLEYGSSLTIPGFDFADATIKTIDEKYIPDSIAHKSDLENVGIQSDWNQNDEAAKDYIKNRTHWASEEIVDYIKEEQYRFSDTGFVGVWTKEKRRFIEGITYTIVFNGVEYICTPWSKDNLVFALGNEACIPGKENMENPTGNNEPFCIYVFDHDDRFDCPYVSLESYMNYFDLQVSGIGTVVHPIDEKYLPDTIAHIEYVDVQLLEKMNSANPIGTGSLSLNRRPETTIGINSVAVGTATTASGNASYAEGSLTVASSDNAHAEGQNTTASMNNAHAEGYYTTASGHASHAEGSYSYATNDSAHAEGYSTEATGVRGSHAEGEDTKATNEASHAEGYWTEANGAYSHSEGCYSKAGGEAAHAEGRSETKNKYAHAEGYFTVASSEYQHVQGKFNNEDASNIYAHIVGNGAGTGDRSNAHTLDWDGNAWFAGDVYVGSTSGTNKDEGSKKLVTTDDVYTRAEIATLVGDTPVADQISEALTSFTSGTQVQFITWEADD